MLLKDITPFVRLARYSVIHKDSPDSFRNVKTRDNRLFFVTDGQGQIVIEGKTHSIRNETLILVRAGEGYRIEPDEKISLFVINFDFTEIFSSLSKSFHPFSVDFPGTLETVYFEDAELLNSALIIQDASCFESIVRRMVNAFSEKNALRDTYISSAMKTLIIELILHRQDCQYVHNSHTRLARSVASWLRENYADRVKNETISDHFHFTAIYINRIFKKEMGITPHQFLIRLRIDIAKKLLTDSDYTPGEVAALVGFANYPHFNKTFKRLTGMTPTQYREQADN